MFKAKSIHDEKFGDSKDLLIAGFVNSYSLLTKFVNKNNLSMQRRATIAQKGLSHLTTKLFKYVIHVRRLSMKTNFSQDCITAMDKTAI